jgi:uncharacterized repeat protein (TIGR01451 family)
MENGTGEEPKLKTARLPTGIAWFLRAMVHAPFPVLHRPIAVAAACLLVTIAGGMQGHASPPAPHHVPAPLLSVRFAAPVGSQVTLYRGARTGCEFDAPVTVGLRPGYLYRVKLARLPGHPDVALFPSLEVRGTLHLPANLYAADYPAPVVITEQDITLALAGGLITKVIYLEDPARAQAVATRPDEPLEITIRPGLDPMDEARAFGRPMLIVRLGARTFHPEEMAHLSVPGTVLLPGERALSEPPVRPCLPWAGIPVYDPIVGPRPPEEECLHDGGDGGVPAGFDQEGHLHGLDPADTVAEYTDNHGQKHLAISNRVCLCVPRFAALVVPLAPAGFESLLALAKSQTALGQEMLQVKQGGVEVRQSEQLVAMRSRERASGMEAGIGTVPVAQIQGRAVVIGLLHEQTVVGALVEKICLPPERPLVLCKTADRQAVQVGDLVTFTLKFTNTGGQPMSGVVVSDSLTGRLEYVPGSAQSDRQAIFTMQANEAGSRMLRWEVAGRLLPGESGVVRFQARVR